MYHFPILRISLLHLTYFDFIDSVASTAGTENDLNYFEIPIDLNAETTLNEIEGRHSTDETVCMKNQHQHKPNIMKLHLCTNM